MAELSKEQKQEIRDICKKVIKEDLERKASGVRILKSYIGDSEEGGFIASVTAYFFTVTYVASTTTDTVRYNMTFKSKVHDTEEGAYEAIKSLASDVTNYMFTKKKTDDYALYKNVYEFTCEEK